MATRATTVQISMPQMGESVTEGTVLGWLKQVGDRVEADEPLVEVSTDKVDAEVPAPAAGTLIKILAEPDATVQVGEALGEIEVDGNGAAPPAAEAPEPEESETEESKLVDIQFPEMGDSVAEGTILEWRVAVGDAVTTEVVATQVVATLVGSIGLIAAVPLTTALAALLALEEEPEALAELELGHSH